MQRNRPLVVTAALIGTICLALGPRFAPTLAVFSASKTPPATLATDTILGPTGLSAVGGKTAALSWTQSASTYAAGYNVLRSTTSGSGYAPIATATPRSTVSYTDSPAFDGTYYYVLTTYDQNWTSAQTAQVSAVVKVGVTGFKACTTQAADTGGDGNGYETSTASACVDDGVAATDVNSGTGTGTTCTGSGKDRHRFWTFGLGLPASVTSINGISVKAKSAISVVTGTNNLCAELSWDAGSAWTAAQQVALTSTALTTYTLGGTAFLWGRTWLVGNFSDANFRVRLTDVANSTARTFSLDTVQVQVNYTP